MSWFDENSDALAAAGISREAAEDFANRNVNADGTKDYHRVFDALREDDQPQEQTPRPSPLARGPGYSGPDLRAAPRPYTPFTEQFNAPTLTALPTWTKGDFAGPSRPGDLMEKWGGGEFAFDPSKIAENRAYKVRLSDTIKAVDGSASARGLTFTNQAREELMGRAGDLASQELDNEFGRQLDTHQTNFGDFTTDKSRRSGEADRLFDEAAGTWGTNRGAFEADRGFTADRNDVAFDQARGTYLDRAGIHNLNETGRYGSERSNVVDSRGWDTELFGRDRALRLDDRAWDTEQWGRARTDRNDTWGRGTDVWGMGRQDRQDEVENNYRLSDLILRNRPRPPA